MLLSGCCGPHVSHLYLSQQPQTAAALTAGRERPLAGNFTPPLPSACPPLDTFLHAFLTDCFCRLNPRFAYQHTEAKGTCITVKEAFGLFVCPVKRTKGDLTHRVGNKDLSIIHLPTWNHFSTMLTYCGNVFEAQ